MTAHDGEGQTSRAVKELAESIGKLTSNCASYQRRCCRSTLPKELGGIAIPRAGL